MLVLTFSDAFKDFFSFSKITIANETVAKVSKPFEDRGKVSPEGEEFLKRFNNYLYLVTKIPGQLLNSLALRIYDTRQDFFQEVWNKIKS